MAEVLLPRMSFLNARNTSTWVVTSSAVVGSSRMSSRGSQIIAMAAITRWSWPPAHLMRVAASDGLRFGQIQLAEERHRPRLRLFLGQQTLHHRHFRDLQAKGERTVEGGRGALRDVGNVSASHLSTLAQGQVEDLPAAETYTAPRDLAPGARVAHARQGDCRLARPRFADQGDHLAGPHVERDAIHDGERAPPSLPCDDRQVPYLEKKWRRARSRTLIPSLPHSSSGSAASVVFRNQSTSMLTETVTRAMHNAGKIGA